MYLTKKFIISTLLLAVIVIAGFLYSASLVNQKFWEAYFKRDTAALQPTPQPKDIYVEFTGEAYDKIKENYWDKIEDDKLGRLYKLAAEKVLANPVADNPKAREEVKTMVGGIIKDYTPVRKEEFVVRLSDVVLANLQPLERSRLYTSQQEKKLKDTLENRDPNIDLYTILGVSKETSRQEIEEIYKKKVSELKSDKSAEASSLLAQINRAYETLSKPEAKKNYDKSGIEPTVTGKLLTPDIFYIKLDKFSPQSFEELFQTANTQNVKNNPPAGGGPTTLILDLRNNVGGAVDLLQYFLGPFIGPDQYAYEFFHQGSKETFKTKIGWFESLVRYKKVVVLIDENSQSSAEIMAAALKKYNVGVLVGRPTKGWGTVEKIVPFSTQISDIQRYSLFIVHSIMLREDGQPIEGLGVDPHIDIQNKNWPQELMAYFNYPQLTNVLKKLFSD